MEFWGSTLTRDKPKDKGHVLQTRSYQNHGEIFPFRIVDSSGFSFIQFRTWYREERSYLLRPCRDLVYELETLRKSEKRIQCWRRKQSQRFWGSVQRRKGAFLGPCLPGGLIPLPKLRSVGVPLHLAPSASCTWSLHVLFRLLFGESHPKLLLLLY